MKRKQNELELFHLDIKTAIRTEMEYRGYRPQEIAPEISKRIGKGVSMTYKKLSDPNKFTIDELFVLCKWLGIEFKIKPKVRM